MIRQTLARLCARYTYKVFEGLAVTGWLAEHQVKLQLVAYASIFEACLRDVLFVQLGTHPSCLKALRQKKLVPILIRDPHGKPCARN
jgi:hypothetical protein